MNVFLDLDGTLTDPKQGIVGCIQHALRPAWVTMFRKILRCCNTWAGTACGFS